MSSHFINLSKIIILQKPFSRATSNNLPLCPIANETSLSDPFPLNVC